MLENVVTTMTDTIDRLLLDKAAPNLSLVEEALSFNVSHLQSVDTTKLREYIVVLGQYLITLQYEENLSEAVYTSWATALNTHVHTIMHKAESSAMFNKRATLKEKIAIIIDEDKQAAELNRQVQSSEARKTIMKNMYRAVEQYINTLKKEIDARDQDKRRI